QQIAMLFLVPLILLTIDKKMDRKKMAFLFIVFGASLVVSHYGLTVIYVLTLVSAWLLLLLSESPKMRNLKTSFYFNFRRFKREKLADNLVYSSAKSRTIGSPLVILFVVFTLGWYAYISRSTVLSSFVQLGAFFVRSISIDILTPEIAERVQLLVTKAPLPMLIQGVNIIIGYLRQILIIFGVLSIFKIYRELKFEKEYIACSMPNFILFLACIAPPFFSSLFLASGIDIGRIYHIALIFLAPFCIIAGLMVFRVICRVVKVSRTNKSERRWFAVFSIYFVIFFLFQSGFIGQVTGSELGTGLDQERLKKYGAPEQKASLYTAFPPEQDVFSARWLSMNIKPGEKIYATYSDIRVHALTSYGMIPTQDVPKLTATTNTIGEDAYVYLQYLNVIEGIGTEFDTSVSIAGVRTIYDMTEVSHLFKGRNKIYSNGGSETYR
ncbi:DUF2206 domain-containing protein, partial [Chloroflexota bacterium]